jgi:RNA polymerase sigma-70 factor (ECF subfamily)
LWSTAVGEALGASRVTHALDRAVRDGQATAEAPAQAVPDAASFREIFSRYAPYVLGLVRRLGVRDAEVEDVAQEVFIVVHRQLPHFEGRSSIKTWLCGITLRTVANHRRKVMRRREAAMDTTQELHAEADQCALLERRDAASTLQQALDRLSPKLREVFVLYEIEELPMADVARSLGCPRFTAYTRLHAARAALRQRLTQPGSAPGAARKASKS